MIKLAIFNKIIMTTLNNVKQNNNNLNLMI